MLEAAVAIFGASSCAVVLLVTMRILGRKKKQADGRLFYFVWFVVPHMYNIQFCAKVCTELNVFYMQRCG